MPFIHSSTMIFCKYRHRCSNRRFNRLLLLGFMTIFSGMKSAYSISMPEVVALAIDKSPEVLASQEQRFIFEQQVKQVYSGYFPSVDISTGFGNEHARNAATRSSGQGMVSLPRTEARLVINQVLFDGFGISNEVRRAQAKYKAADWVYKGKVQDVSLDAINSYFDVQKQWELLDLIKKFSTVQTDFLAKIEEWYTGGAGTIADVWQTESRLALTLSSLATTESQFGIAIDAFARLVGFAPENLDPVNSVSVLLPNSVEQALKKAECLHPILMENQLNLEAAEAIRDAAQKVFWPSVNLALDTNRTTNVNGLEGETLSSLAMIRLNYNLFRGGNDLAVSREALHRVEQALADSERIKRTFRENIEKSWRTIKELRQRLTFLERHESISKQVVAAYYEQFFADKRSLLNVLNAENELFSAQSNRVKGHYALLVEEFRFLANMGMLSQVLATLHYPVESTEVKSTTHDTVLNFSSPINQNVPKVDGEVEEKSADAGDGGGAKTSSSLVNKNVLPVGGDIAPFHTEKVEEKSATAKTSSSLVNKNVLPVGGDIAPSNIEKVEEKSAIYGATLISAKPIGLYNAPTFGEDALMIIPKGTPLRILKSQNGWFQVVDSEGNQMWVAGPITQDGEQNPAWQSGMITLDLANEEVSVP